MRHIKKRAFHLATAATIAVIGFAPAAQARPGQNPITGENPAATVAAVAPNDDGSAGFDWGDAGIGAAAGLLAAGALAGGGARRRRARHPLSA